jgi:predicted dehydrogenase
VSADPPARVRIGVIGAGTMGRLYVDAFGQDRLAELVAVCDLDEVRARGLQSDFGVPSVFSSPEAMLDQGDLDAVVVATPDFLHREPVIAALEHGCHVLCEKPLSMDPDDGRAIVDAVEKSGKKLMVNFGNRHRPQIRRVKQLIDRGQLGSVQHVYVRLNEKRTKRAALAWAARSSPLWFLGSHALDVARWLVGSEISDVYARGYFEPGLKGAPPETVTSTVTFESGTCCTVEASWNLPPAFPRDVDFEIEVLGSEGAVKVDCSSQGLMTFAERAMDESWDWPYADFRGDETGWWHTSCYYFTDCILSGRSPTPDEKDGLAITEALTAMEVSLMEGRGA